MRRRWKIVIAAAVVLPVLIWLWIGNLGSASEKEVEAYKKSLIARGEKLEISQILPPPVPPAQNGADVFNQAAGLLTDPANDEPQLVPAMRMIGPGSAIVCFREPDVRSYDFTNSWEVEMAGVNANRDATEQFRQLINFSALDFDINYKDFPDIWPHFPRSLDSCEAALSTEAICDLHTGDTGAAVTNICALLAVANGLHDARLDECQEYRMELMSIATGPSWELLQATNLDDGELAVLQKSWEQAELIHAMENSILMDRAIGESLISKMRSSNKSAGEVRVAPIPPPVSGSWPFRYSWYDLKFAYARAMWRASWGYSDELRMLQHDQIILETIHAIETNGFFNPTFIDMANSLEAGTTNVSADWVEKAGIPDLREEFSGQADGAVQLMYATMAAEAARKIVITAIALKRYQLKHGNYPPNLSTLVPIFMSAVPRDPVDGQSLRYRLNPDGTFLLYSIGENGKDDGGDASNPEMDDYNWEDPNSLDLVWPQPATPQEIQNFYAHPPR